MRTPFTPNPAHPFQLVKFLSWSSLLLIFCACLFMVVVIGNYAEQSVIAKDKEFSRLLAENLNHQIYQRFTLPTVLGFGKVELKNKAQYERLDQIIDYTIHGFKILKLRIYDVKGRVSYAEDKDLLGTQVLEPEDIQPALQGKTTHMVQNTSRSWWSFMQYDLPAQSFVLKTTFPLRTEQSLSPAHQGVIIGVLQFTQDITDDYEKIKSFQALVTLVVLISAMILFALLYMIIRRADRLIAERIQEKERLERELHQNEKLASMGRMLASIAHEIRNPLGIIQSSSELLAKRSAKANDVGHKLAQAIFDESRRLSRTVNDFLDYARPKEPKMVSVSLQNIVGQAVKFLDHELDKNQIQINWDIPETAQVNGDKDLLYRAIYNLLANACQAMSQAGRIDVHWDAERSALIIDDQGPGFEADMDKKYVEPFFTTKDSGTGLGLAIVSTIITNHRAVMHLDKNPEGGGRVEIVFSENAKGR
ncbi:MAG: histidine kinase dimerization/phospho-acceptor domain-containing protein [Desulfovermiculus sp.]